jgi:hypothetical protein
MLIENRKLNKLCVLCENLCAFAVKKSFKAKGAKTDVESAKKKSLFVNIYLLS